MSSLRPLPRGPLARPPFPAFLRNNWFVLGLVAAVGLAFAWPELGARGGPLKSEVTTRWAVVVIYLLQGLTLPLSALRRGASNWRLHLLVQGISFGFLPLIGLSLDLALGPWLGPELRRGLLYLCVLPSTIKTAVVFSSLAGGDAAAAVFNATLSSTLGVLLTPLLLGLLGTSAASNVSLASVLLEVAELMLLPLVVGLALQRPLARWAEPLKRLTNPVSSCIVLFIVFAAFCNSVLEGSWQEHGTRTLWTTLGLALFVFLLATGTTALLARLLGLARPDTITALFCAPQKTLASGAPLARVLFPNADLGLVLLPLLFYHPLQLILGSLLVARFAKNRD